MPMFDDRFARQNRCEPPPEFPLASPYTGIVHHLSGPNIYALTQIHQKTSGSVDGAPKLPPPFTFITRKGFVTQTLAQMFDSLVRVSRRVADNHYASILAQGAVLSPHQGYSTVGYNTPRREPHSQSFYPPGRTDAGPRPAECTGENTG
jgi:hypothetical protein